MTRSRRRGRLIWGALAVGAVTVTTVAKATETVLDDFESAQAPAPWVFSNGPEFPGATGSLAKGAGHAGNGAVLTYDLTGGGHYVGATLTLATAIQADAIAYWVRAAPGINATLRVQDSSGQTLQYDGSRPLEASVATDWYREVIELDAPSSHYGGDNDGVVHQPIKAVSILASDPTYYLTGTLAFDDVTAIDPLESSLGAVDTPVVLAPSGASDLGRRLAVNIHFTKDDRGLDIAAAAGFSKARMDLGWSGVEKTKGTYDFSALDGLVTSLASRSMYLHLILDYFNSIYPGADSADFSTTTVPAFAALAKAAAAHFAGKGVTFEIWNEPNLAGFWPPTPSATQYAELCKAAIAAVHAGDQNARVSTAGISGFDLTFLHDTLAAGGGDGADAIGVHPYRQTGPESAGADLVTMKALIADGLHASLPVWDTEWGYSSTWYGDGHDPTTQKTQAVRATRELLTAWSLGFPIAVYYDLRDDGTDGTNAEDNFGLVGNDYSDKPAIVAVRTLTTLAKNRSFIGFLATEPSSVHAMRLDGAKDTVVALWTDAPNAKTTVTLPASVGGIDVLGQPVAPGATVALNEANGPVYLTFPKAPPPAMADAGASSKDAGSDGASKHDASVGSELDGGEASGGTGGVAASTGGVSGTGGSSSANADAGAVPKLSSPSSSSGCGCRTVPERSTPLSRFGALAALAVALRLRYATRRRRSQRLAGSRDSGGSSTSG